MRAIDHMTDTEIDTLKLKGMLGTPLPHNWRGQMREKLAQSEKRNHRLTAFLQDAAAFIRVGGADRTWNDKIILATLIHDITGLANDEPCFSPRVTGYAQREQDRKL